MPRLFSSGAFILEQFAEGIGRQQVTERRAQICDKVCHKVDGLISQFLEVGLNGIREGTRNIGDFFADGGKCGVQGVGNGTAKVAKVARRKQIGNSARDTAKTIGEAAAKGESAARYGLDFNFAEFTHDKLLAKRCGIEDQAPAILAIFRLPVLSGLNFSTPCRWFVGVCTDKW